MVAGYGPLLCCFFYLAVLLLHRLILLLKRIQCLQRNRTQQLLLRLWIPPHRFRRRLPQKKGLFVLYGGVTFNNLSVSSNKYESSSQTGWQAGFNYRSGNFIYWQIGARYNSSKYGLRDSVENTFSINDIGIPLTAGLVFFGHKKSSQSSCFS